MKIGFIGAGNVAQTLAKHVLPDSQRARAQRPADRQHDLWM
jgi:hypothetical protein